jgi:hypothetical protein
MFFPSLLVVSEFFRCLCKLGAGKRRTTIGNQAAALAQ